VEKYRCPACAEKELPFLDTRVAAGVWNLIAPKRSYHRRTLEYNRVVQKLQFLNNNRLKMSKCGALKPTGFLAGLVREPTGFLNKSNIHGVCEAEPYKTYEWRDKKKKYHYVTLTFYPDNGVYYYCHDYCYRNRGAGCGLSIRASGFPSLDTAKKYAVRELAKRDRGISKIVKKLLFTFVQGELF
jgi:hypothetical protein